MRERLKAIAGEVWAAVKICALAWSLGYIFATGVGQAGGLVPINVYYSE